MSEMVTVGISDMKIARVPQTLVTYALGSCVGICIRDPFIKIGALGHIMLPTFPAGGAAENQRRYADTCIPLMLSELEKLGCLKGRLEAKIAGGAKMFQVADDTAFGNIGLRNVTEVKRLLLQYQIRILAEDTGKDYGRTVFYQPESGEMLVKSFANGTKSF